MRLITALLVTFVLSSFSAPSVAATLIPAANRADMVHDAKRGRIYVTNGPNLVTYLVNGGALLTPINFGGNLAGIDLSPDGNTLAIADKAGSATYSWVYLVQLDTLSVTQVAVAKAFGEGGIFTVAYGADNNIYTTSTFEGSGWVPFRQLVPSTGQWTTLATLNQDTMLTPSGDAQTIAFAESNISDGEWGLYDIPTGQLVHRTGYTDGTNWFNFEIGAERFGTQFAIPTYDGTFIYDDNYVKIGTLGVYAGQQPIGVAYHPVDQTAYFPWAGSSQVRIYDMHSLQQTGSYDFGDQFSATGNHAFVQGRTRLSRDGSLLMVSVTGGVALQSQYAPLSASSVSVSTNAGQAVNITLQGAIGNNGALSYEITVPPSFGTATVNGGVATYTPAVGFSGSDSFAYRVHYGRAVADAKMAITVVQPNTSPVAIGQTININEDTAVVLTLQASDADGDPLAYSIVTQPQHGTLSGSGSNRVYTPSPNFNGSDSFTFAVSDGKSASNAATVTLQVASVNDAPVAISGATINTNEDIAVNLTLQASDLDGDPLTYTIVTQPQHGTLTGSGPNRVYTPATNFNGADSFTFAANDGHVSSNIATVNLQVANVNDAPVARPDNATVVRNDAVTISVLANDGDVDGDILMITDVSTPTHGTAAISGNGIEYTPARGYSGVDQFNYSISDGHGGNATATVSVSVLKK